MKNIRDYLLGSLIAGLLVIVPVYLSILLLLKAMASVAGLVKPIARLLPSWLPGEAMMALLLMLGACLIVGMLVKTRTGQAARERIERSLFERMPGYSLLRSLTQQMAGESLEQTWRPALVEIEEALVPAFIIEEFEDGRYTVFVPSVPTPLAGAIYILEPGRVHPLDVSFTQAVKAVSRWGEGVKGLVKAMEGNKHPGNLQTGR